MMTADQINMHILALYPEGYEADEVISLDPSTSLDPCRHWKIEAPKGTFCLRRRPENHLKLDKLQFIQAVLWHAVCEGIDFIPLPIETFEHQGYVHFDRSFWELMPWIHGNEGNSSIDSLAEKDLKTETVPSGRHETGAMGEMDKLEVLPFQIVSAMMSLAQFHLATADFPLPDFPLSTSPGIRENLVDWEKWISGRVSQLYQILRNVLRESISISDSSQEYHRLAQKGLDLLEWVVPHAGSEMILLTRAARLSVPIQPVIGNIVLRHLRFNSEGVCGFLDFKEVQVDGVPRDIASLLGSLAEADASYWTLGLKAYQSIRPLSDNELYMVKAFDLSQLFLEGLRYLASVFLQGEQRTLLQLREISQRLDRIVFRLSREFLSKKSA